MKIEFAFSLDYMDVVDANDAYDLFWSNTIKDKHNFECIGNDCTAQVTCANLDKLWENMKKAPYFKAYGEHSKNCSYLESQVKYYSEQKSSADSNCRGRISNKAVDVLNFKRPKSHLEKNQKYFQLNLEQQLNLKIQRKKRAGSYSKKSRTKIDRYSIRPFIDNYYKYRQKQSLEDNYIKIKTAKLSYAEMFIEIDSQNVDDLPDYLRFYCGTARLYSHKTYYYILFDKCLILNEEKIRPSIFVKHQIIEEAFCRSLIEKKFQSLSGSYIYCFIYAKPSVNSSNGKNYINFSANNLDYLEIKKDFSELYCI